MGFTLVLLSVCTNAILLWCSCMSMAHSPRGSNGMDRVALLAFKARITDDPLGIVSSWNDSIPYCQWPGIICGGRMHPNRVKALYLPSKGLVGTMALEIGNLSFLQEIWLKNNSFHGEIPHEVSFLSKLSYLNLSFNSFGGEIPPNISHCSNLLQLGLSKNNLVGRIPAELGTFSKLRRLAFDQNSLTGQIPSSFGNLSSLKALVASDNGFSGSIPDTLGQMRILTYLHLGGNKLSGTVPPSIYNLSSLSLFDVGINLLQGGLPPNLGLSLPNLRGISISENRFQGPIPISLSNLSKLEVFTADRNFLTGKVAIHFGSLARLTRFSLDRNHLGNGEADDLSFINTLTNCSSLTVLAISVNRFGGVLPNSIANLSTQLSLFAVADNQIFGNIPIGLGNLVSLLELDLSCNLLEGTIPTSIGRLHMLNGLYLHGNQLTGPIPSSLGNLAQLVELFLNDNRLHGRIPSSIEKWKYLNILHFSSNNFNGAIPKKIFDLSSLIELRLARNSFSGSLPMEVGRLINLEIFEVSENMLSGAIPSSLGTCTSLEHLFMKGNLFQGSIPLSLNSLRGIQDLDLSHNNFSGFIPKYLETFKFLQNLNLSFNHLEGEVPVEGVFGNLTAISIIGNNKLCGGIPELHLPACQTQKPKEDSRSHVLRLVTIICAASLCLVFMAYLCITRRRREEKKKSSFFFMGDRHFQLSYSQLLKATDGFSSSNLIGVGSFGSVYKGVLNHGKTIVAIKVLNIEQRGASKSFMAECEALRNVRHRNLVKILTACSSTDFDGNDFKALVYEFMPGGSLEEWLHPPIIATHDEQRHLNLVQRLNIAIDMATALDYLHHHCHMQIIHCDLKPSNVLLDDDLTAHLGDFGISRILSEVTNNSQNQPSSIGIKGSIGYIPPEYGAGANISIHGDVYSYGILLLEMFTRKRPTDVMFKDNFNIHFWAEMALHDGMLTVVDPSLFPMEEDDEEEDIVDITESKKCMKDRVRECVNLIIKIGVTCSAESPADRMDMNDVVKELHTIRKNYLGVGTHPKEMNFKKGRP